MADEDAAGKLTIELNAAQAQNDACVLSFLVQNGHATDIETVVFEAVLFNGEGQVDRLTLFDFGTLPSARPRVRQFVVPNLDCDGLSRIIFNGASQCTGTGVTPAMCAGQLSLTSRIATEVSG
ncbi:hypothetical protein [Marivita sp. S0852]|uniref:hypothetical protein n=1 Tax=Marivita sp. S0852 TaxID=3373893 RepID=UPI003981B3F7